MTEVDKLLDYIKNNQNKCSDKSLEGVLCAVFAAVLVGESRNMLTYLSGWTDSQLATLEKMRVEAQNLN